MHPTSVLQSLWSLAEGDPAAIDNVRFTSIDRPLPSVFQIGPLAAATIAAQALAAAEIWRERTGRSQRVSVDMRHAMAMFRSERYLTVDGKPPADLWCPLSGYYQAGDGRWIQLHTNFPHHRDGVLKVLQCANERGSVARAIAGWSAHDLDQRLAEEGMCAAMIRTAEEWQAHPQAAAIAALPLLEIERIGDAPPEPIGRGASVRRPLSGVRMLDLSRIIAAPVAGRAFAQHGAEVLAVSAAHLPNLTPLVIDTGRGKRTAHLDLRDAEASATLRRLIREADVFMQAYRPGSLAARGLSPKALSEIRPGLIHVSLSAYSHAGPWAERRGFDSLVQSATGIAWEEGRARGLAEPGKLPCQALDHATGYLAAFGAMIALRRRAREGGSWLVRVSLAQTGHWLQSLGTQENGLAMPDFANEEVSQWLQVMESPFGSVSAVTPAEQMSETAACFETPPVPLGTHRPVWTDVEQ